VDHSPRVLTHGLPSNGVVTSDDLRALSSDPYWRYGLDEGRLVVSSDAQAITWDDLQNFPDLPNWRFELLEGSLILSPNSPSYRHQTCAFSLAILLRQACSPQLAVVMGPFEYVPVPTSSMQPDVLIARRPVAARRLTQAPVLTVEVLSPSTRRYDQGQKRAAYAKYGVEHYWIVDPAGPSVQALRLLDGEYVEVAQAAAGETFEAIDPVKLSFDPASLPDE
jgi:Uma2 family endonuclease